MVIGKLVKFLKERYVIPAKDFAAEDFKNSDFGRTYGWWVLLDGVRVASLEYRSFLEEPVHLYAVHALHETFFRIELDPKKWANPKLTVQSRYAEAYEHVGLEMASVGDGMIVVQNLFLPEIFFRAQHEKVLKFHDNLLAKAEEADKVEEEVRKRATAEESAEGKAEPEEPITSL